MKLKKALNKVEAGCYKYQNEVLTAIEIRFNRGFFGTKSWRKLQHSKPKVAKIINQLADHIYAELASWD